MKLVRLLQVRSNCSCYLLISTILNYWNQRSRLVKMLRLKMFTSQILLLSFWFCTIFFILYLVCRNLKNYLKKYTLSYNVYIYLTFITWSWLHKKIHFILLPSNHLSASPSPSASPNPALWLREVNRATSSWLPNMKRFPKVQDSSLISSGAPPSACFSSAPPSLIINPPASACT